MEKEAGHVTPADPRFEHGIHAFIFLSFIFAETLTLTIHSWIAFSHSTIPLKGIVCQPEVTLLLAITVLTVEYWWAVFESAAFYGDNLLYFLFGVLESGTFYVVAFLLRDFLESRVDNYASQLRRVFICFLVLIFLFIATDLMKLFEYKRLAKGWFWQLLRVCGLVTCAYGSCGHEPWIAASILLALVVLYTILVIIDAIRKKLSDKPPATPQEARARA